MPMSDEQVQALMQNWRDALARQMDEMRVRQWCVEQSIKSLDGVRSELPPEATAGAKFFVVVLAEDILQFITAPFAETLTQRNDDPNVGT